jgi:hypothetical protein
MSLFSALNMSTSTLNKSAASGTEKSPSKVFKPGLHEIKVVEVSEPKPDSTDATWMNYLIKFEGVGGQRTSAFVRVPTTTLAHARDAVGRTEEYRLRVFLRSLGRVASNETLLSDLEATFGAPKKGLVGKTLSVEIGYKKYHTSSRGKGEVVILDGKGAPVLDADGEELVFPDFASARAEGERLYGNKFQAFPEVVKYVKSEKTETSLPVKKKAGFGA